MIKDKLKILVVDDEAQLRDLLTEGLQSMGCLVRSAESAVQALEILKNGLQGEPWDVLITDLNLADQSGVWLLKEGKKINRDLVVLIITGYGSVESAVEALQLGASDYIQKPFNLETLKLKLERSWQAQSLSRENRLLKRDLALYQIYDLFMGNPDREKLLNITMQSIRNISGSAGIKVKLKDGTQITSPEWKEEFEFSALQASLESRGRKYGMIFLKTMEGELDANQRTGLALLSKNVSLSLENMALMTDLKDRMDQLEAQRGDLLDSYKFAVLGEISSSLVHEMRNPLSAITLGVEYFGMCIGGDEKLKKALNSISKSVERLNNIIDNLSLYSKENTGTQSTVLLSDIIDKAVGLINYYLAAKKIKVEFNNGDYEKPVLVNLGQIQQALVDILVFQSKKMNGGGEIKIEIKNRDGEMALEIFNASLKVDLKELEKMMEPNLDSWQPGHDLSLNLARRLLEENLCRFKVQNQRDGTLFDLDFNQHHYI
jgi:DNA-binding response OmpR family regulator